MIEAPQLPILVVCAAVLILASIGGPHLHRGFGDTVWFAFIFLWAAVAYAAARFAARAPSRAALGIILVSAALMRIPMVTEAPYLSTDVFRYVWDGRVQGSGINPYLYIPAAPEVAHLRDALIYPNINRADYAPTIYPPTAQMVFWFITRFGDGVLVMKLGLLVFEAAAIVAVIGMLRQMSLPITNVVAFAWHPLPVWEIAGNAHVDIVMISFMMIAMLVALHGRITAAGVLASVAAFAKPTALLLLPVFWRPWNWKLPLVLLAVGTALYAPYLGAGRKVLGFLGGYVAEEGLSSGGGFRYLKLLEALIGPITYGGQLYLVGVAAILLALAVRIGFREDRSMDATVKSAATLVIAFLVLLTPHYPWYYLALTPFLALQPRLLTPWVLATGGFLIYDVGDGFRFSWHYLREDALHVLALFSLGYDYWRARTPREPVRT